ncbi:hypothetical protein V1498_03295 [Peribacillus sp. SCS-26]|uniref:hypothetical protein n=1 Tax=Paraperibacillus marinus TaxID=3115295 RepID=UPI003905D393
MKYLSFLLIIGLLLAGCSSAGSTSEKKKELTKKEKQEIILDFVNEDTKKASDYEVEAFQSLGSVSGENYTDDKTLYDELVNKTMPAYKKAVDAAKDIKPKMKELEGPTDKIVKASETFYKALELEKEALEKSDKEIIQKSNDKMKEYQDIIADYHKEMEKVTKKYNVDYEPRKTQP